MCGFAAGGWFRAVDGLGNCVFLRVEGVAGSGKSLSSSAASGYAAQAPAAAVTGQGPPLLDSGFSMVPALAKAAFDRDTRNRPAMAPQRMESLLALAVATARPTGPQADFAGGEGAHSSHGDRKRPVGTETYPGGAGKVGIQGIFCFLGLLPG